MASGFLAASRTCCDDDFCESLIAPDPTHGLRCFIAVATALRRLEGRFDREAVEQFTFVTHWKCAAGGLQFDHPVGGVDERTATHEFPNKHQSSSD
jgi:hypothetical protein